MTFVTDRVRPMDHSDATLAWLGSVIAGRRLAVMRSPRLKHRGLAVLEPPTLYVRDVDWGELFALAAAAGAAVGRGAVSVAANEHPIAVPQTLVRDGIAEMPARLEMARRLAEAAMDDVADAGGGGAFAISRSEVAMNELPGGAGATPTGPGGLSFSGLPHGIIGADGDFDALLEWLDDPANWDEEARPPLNVPVATVPVEIRAAPGGHPDCGEWEDRRESVMSVAKDMAECMRRRLEDDDDTVRRGWRTSGRRIDRRRLHLAGVSMREPNGPPPAIYHRERSWNNPLYDPRHYAGVLGVDTVELCSDAGMPDWMSELSGNPRMSASFPVVLMEVVRQLEISSGIVVFADRLVTTKRGRKVLMHRPMIVKRPDEPFDNGVLARFATAVSIASNGKREEVSPCRLESLQYATMMRYASEWYGGRQLASLIFDYCGGMSVAGRGSDRPTVDRIARDVERGLSRLALELDCDLGGVAFVPATLAEAAKVGGPFDSLIYRFDTSD